ncbi:MAG: SAVED domain-containing protein [bacterium]|nr:SAVED domain-containing protein [bacterium]
MNQTLPSTPASRLARLAASRVPIPGRRCRPPLSTRGTRQSGGELTLDATALVGGARRRPGSAAAWRRFLAALSDVEAALKAHSANREIVFRLGLHLSAALALGRIFHQAAGWRLAVEGCHGVARLDAAVDAEDLRVVWDQGSSGADEATLEIELLPHPVRAMATDLVSTLAHPLRGRLQFWRESRDDLKPEHLAALSKAIALETQRTCGDKGVRLLHVLCAAPVELAVLLGHQLTGMEIDLQLYERDADGYAPSLIVPAATP